MTVGMKPLGEGAKDVTQLMVGKTLVQIDRAQTLKLAERVPLCRCETAGRCGARAGRSTSILYDRHVA